VEAVLSIQRNLPFAPIVLASASMNNDNLRKALIDKKWRNFTLTALAICLMLALWARMSAAQTTDAAASSASGPHNIKTVFVIVMENHNWTGGGSKVPSIKGNVSAPYINYSLLPMASHAENYFNPPHNHPSLPNYLWMEAGTNFGIHDDASPYVHHQSTRQHLVTLLEQKGISWKDYDARSTGKDCPIKFWHNPFVFFDDVTGNNNLNDAYCIAHNRPMAELQRDLAADTVARYNFIVPNLCDSMHSTCPNENGQSAITVGDKWLSTVVPDILKSTAYRSGGALFIVWDEATGGTDGPIPLLLLSPLAKGSGYSNSIHYTHGSLLRTVEEIFGVTPLLNDAAKEQDLSDLFSVFP
jgi:phosphatidylinositol-3-phosphatase